jgi:hypothetical protein
MQCCFTTISQFSQLFAIIVNTFHNSFTLVSNRVRSLQNCNAINATATCMFTIISQRNRLHHTIMLAHAMLFHSNFTIFIIAKTVHDWFTIISFRVSPLQHCNANNATNTYMFAIISQRIQLHQSIKLCTLCCFTTISQFSQLFAIIVKTFHNWFTIVSSRVFVAKLQCNYRYQHLHVYNNVPT